MRVPPRALHYLVVPSRHRRIPARTARTAPSPPLARKESRSSGRTLREGWGERAPTANVRRRTVRVRVLVANSPTAILNLAGYERMHLF